MRPVADPGLPRARVDRGKAARGFSALARGVVAEPWDEPAPLRAAPVGPERGCKAQASAQACLSDRLAARRSRAGSGRAGGGVPGRPRWWGSLLVGSVWGALSSARLWRS